MSVDVIYEDEFILVAHKSCGLMVEPDRNNHPNLQQQVKAYLKRTAPAGAAIYAQHIHRLDRPVSGIILFAKQKSVLRNLSEQFANRTVKKYYQAYTSSSPSAIAGTLSNWHRKEKKKAAIYDENIEFAEHAILNYRVKALAPDKFLWDIELHTGKFHQIRAQLAHIGFPIWGDEYYGSDVKFGENSIALNACKLMFAHPISGEQLSFESYDL